MKYAICTICLSGRLDEKMVAAAAAGFKYIDIFETDLFAYHGTPRDVRRLAADLGLEIIAFQPFRDFEGMPAERRAQAFARAEQKLDVTAELGCPQLLVCSNCSPYSLGGIDRAADDFAELGDRAARRGLRVGFEALAWGRHINDFRDSWEVVRRAAHDSVGLVLDTFHIYARKTDLSSVPAIPRDRIFMMQLADAPILDMDVLSWSRHFRVFPGQGEMPLRDFMTRLNQTGYDDFLSLEIFNDQFRAGSTRQLALDGHRSIVGLLERTESGTSLKPPVHVRETAFIEFAIPEPDAAAFAGLLRALGFSRNGSDATKSLTRWSQGAIELVVNTGKAGVAHAYATTNGPAVCGIGLRVDDSAAALERAKGLLHEPVRRADGPIVPAVSGLGGSLLYFTDAAAGLEKILAIEPEPAEEAPPGVGLTSIDHIAQAVPFEEIPTWTLFYASLLAVDKVPAQDVLDPGGLVTSMAVQGPDGALRIAMNASQAHRTQCSRYIRTASGPGVHHIAFATDDIFATAAALRANGVETMPVPGNYYDDLEPRLGVDRDLIDRLRASDILYDRDGDGEYFQIYTASFEDRFFFEFVQRRGYRGLAVLNAPVRLVVQARLAKPAG